MANTKFAVAVQRLIPWIGYHHVIMMVIVSAICFLAITLAGCSSYSTLTHVYLTAFEYAGRLPNETSPTTNLTNVLADLRGSAQLEVRVGYFGVCVRSITALWVCDTDPSTLTAQIGQDLDPLNLIELANVFRTNIAFPALLILSCVLAFINILLLATFPGWHEERDAEGNDIEVKPFPSRPVTQIVAAIACAISFACLTGMLWQHSAAVAAATSVESASGHNVKAAVGATAMLLGWIATALLIIAAVAVIIMIMSIRALDRLT